MKIKRRPGDKAEGWTLRGQQRNWRDDSLTLPLRASASKMLFSFLFSAFFFHTSTIDPFFHPHPRRSPISLATPSTATSCPLSSPARSRSSVTPSSETTDFPPSAPFRKKWKRSLPSFFFRAFSSYPLPPHPHPHPLSPLFGPEHIPSSCCSLTSILCPSPACFPSPKMLFHPRLSKKKKTTLN